MDNDYSKNSTNYECENINCKCIPGRMLCGEEDSIDLGAFLQDSIKGPASFSCLSTDGGGVDDGCKFQEPAMNDLIKNVFSDESITLNCDAGECLYKFDVPGYERPVKRINTPLIAGVIAGCALFVVAVILLVWYLSRRSFSKYGPIHLGDDSDDENAKLMADHKPAALYFENVSYHINGKQILSGVQGVVHSGQLLAIMGASGAGKTSFLDILARKNKRGLVQGDFYVNGEKVSDDEYRSVIGFVDQEDTMLPTLTVHETIMTSALLRLPRDMSFGAKEQRVYEVEKQLGIHAIRDQLIGSEEGSGRGISGGEKRRVGIACELVTSPSILFLDEPTSGLDAFNAFNVIECLVTLAKTYNRTVVFTIHQPRSNIVALFDQLILLARGTLVYSGEFSRCQQYFDQSGYSCPPGFNIADYLVDLTMHASQAQTSIIDDGSMFDAGNNDMHTRSSSVRGVKSIPSITSASMDNSIPGSPSSSYQRPKAGRRDSVKQKQDRQLYTRKKSTGAETPGSARTEDAVPPENDLENTQQWLPLSRRAGNPPLDILEDPHQLPPEASESPNDLDILISNYASSEVSRAITDDIQAALVSARTANGDANGAQLPNGFVVTGTMKSFRKVGWTRQFVILSQRTWRNLYRNPMLMLTHYAIAILLAVLSGFLFYGLTDDIKGFQNRLGLFFFILALFGFSTLTSLNVFASERLLFVRERANGYYSPITYFAAKVVFDIVPLRLIPPIIMGSIVYPMVGLVPTWPEFFKFILILVLFNLAAAAICLFIGIVFKDGGVANLIGSLVMLFSLLFAGLLLNHDAIPKSALWLQQVGVFTVFEDQL
jgi:ABC-type multidrug transport system ATPase subunit